MLLAASAAGSPSGPFIKFVSVSEIYRSLCCSYVPSRSQKPRPTVHRTYIIAAQNPINPEVSVQAPSPSSLHVEAQHGDDLDWQA